MVARVISLGLNGHEITGEALAPMVHEAVSDARAIGGGIRADSDRYGGAATVAHSGAMDRLRKFRMDNGIQAASAAKSFRTDGLASGANSFPRDFEFIYQKVLEEKRKPLNFEKVFPVDTSVPLGARKHIVRRILGTGDAVITRTGTDIPVVGQQRIEEEFPVIYIAAAVETDWFDLISDDFEGRRRFQNDTAMAIRAIRERMNDVMFNGDVPSNMFGALNYPTLPKAVSPLTWKAGAGGSAAVDIVADLNTGANFAAETSGGTFSPTRMITSHRVRNFLMQAQNSVASDISIGDFWLTGQADIDSIEPIHEMKAIGPAGEDGIMFYRDEQDSVAAVVIQAPTAMPVFQKDSFRSTVVYIAAIGGVIQRDVGNNNLRLVATS